MDWERMDGLWMTNWERRLTPQNTHFPLSLTIPHQSLRIGAVHGQQIVPAGDADMLAALARQMDVDVLISGGTHRCVRRVASGARSPER
jgi:putative phosphoesterase